MKLCPKYSSSFEVLSVTSLKLQNVKHLIMVHNFNFLKFCRVYSWWFGAKVFDDRKTWTLLWVHLPEYFYNCIHVVASNVKMTESLWFGEDVRGSCHIPFEVLCQDMLVVHESNFIDQGSSWKSNIYVARHDVPRIFWNHNFITAFTIARNFFPILNHMNRVLSFPSLYMWDSF